LLYLFVVSRGLWSLFIIISCGL